jgi:hypothetical protein
VLTWTVFCNLTAMPTIKQGPKMVPFKVSASQYRGILTSLKKLLAYRILDTLGKLFVYIVVVCIIGVWRGEELS